MDSQRANVSKRTRNPKKGGRSSVPRHLPLVAYVPSSKNITMTYGVSNAIVEGAAGSGVTYFYRLNSVYDPDYSGVGAVATGYNTWSGLFLNYKVKKATVRVQATVTGLATGGMANVVIAPVAGQAVVPANKQTWKCMRGAKFKAIANNAVGGVNLVDMVATWDLAWVASVTPSQYEADMDFSGAVGSNPARQLFVMLAVDSVASGTVVTCNYNIQITYLVEWFNSTPMQ